MSDPTPFQKGDEVECVDSSGHHLLDVGRHYTIQEIHTIDGDQYLHIGTGDTEYEDGWEPYQFRLVRRVPEPVWEGPRWRTVKDHGQPPSGALVRLASGKSFLVADGWPLALAPEVVWLPPGEWEGLLPPLSAVEPPPQAPEVTTIPAAIVEAVIAAAYRVGITSPPEAWDRFRLAVCDLDEAAAAGVSGAAAGAMKEGT